MTLDELEINGFTELILEEFDGEFEVGPLEHSIDEAIEGTLEEDKDVVFDEISE